MTNLVNESRQMNLCDTNATNDVFGFYLDKGIDLIQVDAENKIASLEARVRGCKKYIMMCSDSMSEQQVATGNINPITAESYDKAVNDLMKLESQLQYETGRVEQHISNREDAFQPIEEIDSDSKSEGAEIVDFLHCYVNTLANSDLVIIYQTAIDKHREKEISWYHYLVISLSVLRRLARRTNKAAGWHEELARIQANRDKYQPHREVPTADDSFSASMSIDMEAAIDNMRYYRRMAKHFNCSIEDFAASLDV